MTLITAFQSNAFQVDAFQIEPPLSGSPSSSGGGGGGGRTQYVDFIGYVRSEKDSPPKRIRKKARKLKILYDQHISHNTPSLLAANAKVIAGVLGNYVAPQVWDSTVSNKVLPKLQVIDFEAISENARDLERLQKALLRSQPASEVADNDDEMIMALMTTILLAEW